jgi:hypothetical protein
VVVGNKTLSQRNFSVDVPLQNEGENKITVTAQDDLGKIMPIVITVIKDTIGPVFMYAGNRVTSIDRWIAEGNFTVGISDEAGIADVTLNGKKILSDDGKTWTIQLNDLRQESGNLVGKLTARDPAANETHINIIAKPDPGEEELWKLELAAFKENRYDDVWDILDTLEKKYGINASVRLFRGMIAYHWASGIGKALAAYNALQQGYDKQLKNKKINVEKGTVDYLELALADAETYPENSDNIHYNRYYLGMSYYKQYILAKQIELEDTVIRQKKTKAIENLTSFIKNAGNRVPTFKQDAERILKELK